MRATRRARVAVVAALLLLSGCSDDTGPASGSGAVTGSTGPAGSTVGSAPGPGPVWLAAFRVEADANALDADTQAILDAAGPAIFAGPVACFQDFPEGVAPSSDAYVLGVIASTRDQVDEAVARVGLTPIFVERLTNTCVD